jgi:hypothetical protein
VFCLQIFVIYVEDCLVGTPQPLLHTRHRLAGPACFRMAVFSFGTNPNAGLDQQGRSIISEVNKT